MPVQSNLQILETLQGERFFGSLIDQSVTLFRVSGLDPNYCLIFSKCPRNSNEKNRAN